MKSSEIICFSHLPSFFNFSTGKRVKNLKAHIFLTALKFSIEWCMKIKNQKFHFNFDLRAPYISKYILAYYVADLRPYTLLFSVLLSFSCCFLALTLRHSFPSHVYVFSSSLFLLSHNLYTMSRSHSPSQRPFNRF